ncbi:hypothetical protein [Tepidiphilus succinatimandens]|uniref:hypothetical protein n=1 Tax=Tepidiphilus succinatimandens TaxID=224436 RepID=UPI00112F0588|nr:hypothetical protein [Tepidiphilus succinatimandens]
MDVVERIERGMATIDDAAIVRRLMGALAGMMCVMPSGTREMSAYRMAEKVLAEALEYRHESSE